MRRLWPGCWGLRPLPRGWSQPPRWQHWPARFALIGVLSGRNSGGGAALIAVDGKPAKPFRVGAAVDEGLVLQALGPRQAQLGRDAGGPATLTLDMPLKR